MDQGRQKKIREAVGKWLKDARLKAGVSVDQAAASIRQPVTLVERFEAGAVAVPLCVMARLVRRYKVPVDSVLKLMVGICQRT